MLGPLRPSHFAYIDQALNALFQFNERTVIGHAQNASFYVCAYRIAFRSVKPRIRRELLESQRYPLLFFIELQDLNVDFVTYMDQVARMRQASPRHVSDVQQAIKAAEVNECAVLRQVLHRAGKNRALFEV